MKARACWALLISNMLVKYIDPIMEEERCFVTVLSKFPSNSEILFGLTGSCIKTRSIIKFYILIISTPLS